MEEKEEITYLSLLRKIRYETNVIERLDNKNRRMLANTERFLMDRDEILLKLACSKDETINVIDRYLIWLINDIDTLKEYFSKRFSPDFTDPCRKKNKFDKSFIEDEFEAIGRKANHIADSYFRESNPRINRFKWRVVGRISKEYDKSEKVTVEGYSNEKMKFTSSKDVLTYIRDLYEGDFVHIKYDGKPSPAEIGKKMKKNAERYKEILKDKGIKTTETVKEITVFLIACNEEIISNNMRLDAIDRAYNNWRGRKTETIAKEEDWLEDEIEILQKFSKTLYDKLFQIVTASDSKGARTSKTRQILDIENSLGTRQMVSKKIDDMIKKDKQEEK